MAEDSSLADGCFDASWIGNRTQAQAQWHDMMRLLSQQSDSVDLTQAIGIALQYLCQIWHGFYGESWLPVGSAPSPATPLVCHGHWGEPEPEAATQPLPMTPRGADLAEQAWHRRQWCWLQGVDLTAAKWDGSAGVQAEAGSALAMPILAEPHPLAVLVVYRPGERPPSSADQTVLNGLMSQLQGVFRLLQTIDVLTQRQQRHERLLDTLPGIVFQTEVNADWSMRYLSAGCEALTGYQREELTDCNSGLSYNTITHPDDLSSLLATIQQAMETGQSYGVEYRLQTRTGEEKWVWEKGRGVYDGAGRLTGGQGFITDITPLKRIEAALRQSEARYRLLADYSYDLISRHTQAGVCLYASPACETLLGVSVAGLMGQNYLDWVHPEDREGFQMALNQILANDTPHTFCCRMRHRNQGYRWMEIVSRRMVMQVKPGDPSPPDQTVLSVFRDVTARKQQEDAILRQDRLLRGVAEASRCLLTCSTFSQAMAAVLQILGEAAGVDRVYIYENHPHSTTGAVAMSMRYEWTRSGIAPSIHQPHWQDLPYSAFGLQRWYAAFAAGASISGLVQDLPPAEKELLKRDNILSILMVPILVDSSLWGYIGFDACQEKHLWTMNEESILIATGASIGGAIKRQATEAQMSYQAYHDMLTGLPNRAYFNQQLALAIAEAQAKQRMMAVVFIDLDHFKTINDTLGHAVGDQLLQEVTARLAQALATGNLICRWGGDEFTLILPDLGGPEDAAQVAQQLSQSLRPAFRLHHHDLYITSSIGIALFPRDGQDMNTLMQHADMAMYRAKAQGRNNYQFYTLDLSTAVSSRLLLDHTLHQALERQELVLYYQPQLNVVDGRVLQVEALVRWQHPGLGLVSPQVFIPLAEDNGLIIPIGEWVLHQACRQVMRWSSQGLGNLRVAVNLSVRQLQHPNLLPTVRAVLQRTGLSPQRLELEITETAAMADRATAMATLSALKRLGVRISMDDFGTGYSCLSRLKDLPLDGLKIDRAFVQDLPASPQNIAMVTAIIAMAQGLDLTVVAEGVETQEQLDCLRRLGCSSMQGYWFSRPLPAATMASYLRSNPQALSSSTHESCD